MTDKARYDSRHIVFIGPQGGGDTPANGASIKNYHILNQLQKYCPDITCIDTELWRRNPLILLKVLKALALRHSDTIIISTSPGSAYGLLRLLRFFPRTRNVFYWVIGGMIARQVRDGERDAAPFSRAERIIVEGEGMRRDFAEAGVSNVTVMPNFKEFGYIPPMRSASGKPLRFVFLSRVIPQKGCDIIMEAVEILNKAGHQDEFDVTFHGPVEETYRNRFEAGVGRLPNVSYGGFLDLREQSNYNKLAEYDVMLFPTFWPGEGFPGIAIDAFISGIPVIASRWNMNHEVIADGCNGVIIPPHDPAALAEAMLGFIREPAKAYTMGLAARQSADRYRVENVVTEKVLKEIGIL